MYLMGCSVAAKIVIITNCKPVDNSCPSGCPVKQQRCRRKADEPPRDLKSGRAVAVQRGSGGGLASAVAAHQCGKHSSTLCSDSSSNIFVAASSLATTRAKAKHTGRSRASAPEREGRGRGLREGRSVVCCKGSVHSKYIHWPHTNASI